MYSRGSNKITHIGSIGHKRFGKPRPLSEEEIKDVAYRFGYGAKFLHSVGADGVELHGAHGYPAMCCIVVGLSIGVFFFEY